MYSRTTVEMGDEEYLQPGSVDMLYLPQLPQHRHVVQQHAGSSVSGLQRATSHPVRVLTHSMWDWSTSRKTGTVKLQLGAGSVITNARFVNELFERVVVLAEISEPH